MAAGPAAKLERVFASERENVESPRSVSDSGAYRVLALDGGGIKGVFAASVLASLEADFSEPIGEQFDLISGTSTGGIIALALGLGLTASEILDFYNSEGPTIFGRPGGVLARVGAAKHESGPLRAALEGAFGDRLLGEATTRLVIPSLNLETGEVHVFKTAHHERFERDYKERVVDIALATAAAPAYFPTHKLPDGTPLIDGGIWANNPMGAAAVEALGVLDWPKGSVRLLSIGCTESPPTIKDSRRAGMGWGRWAPHLVSTFMHAQSSASLGTAQLLLGHINVHRISKTVSGGRYALDGVDGIESLKGLGSSEARIHIPKVRAMFLTGQREPFVPVRRLQP